MGDEPKLSKRSQAVQRLVLDRLYHEDLLLTQRTYNFLTFNVFLGAVLVLGSSGSSPAMPGLWYIISFLGVIVACLQVTFGRRIDVAIAFWREYLKLLEADSGLPVDHMLFDFYRTGQAKTEWGRIGTKLQNRRAMFEIFPWNRMPSTNVMIGVLLPWLIATLWFAAVMVRLYRGSHFIALGLTSLVFLLVTTRTWIWPLPGNPRAERAQRSDHED
jgi:hypothetical protein